jgi:hypothetical protein
MFNTEIKLFMWRSRKTKKAEKSGTAEKERKKREKAEKVATLEVIVRMKYLNKSTI